MKKLKSFHNLFLIAFLALSFKAQAQIGTPPVVNGDLNVCLLSSASLSATDPTNTPGATFIWYTKSILNTYTPFDTSDAVVIGPLALGGNYGVATYNPGNGDLSSKTDFSITVSLSTHADVIVATPADASVCAGASTTYSVPLPSATGSVTYRWYDAAINGTLLHEGLTYTTGPLNLVPTIFVSGVNVGGCESARQAVVPVVVLPNLALPITGASSALICSGDSLEFFTTNKSPGDVVNWYTSLLSNTPVFTGDTLRLTEENTGAANLPITYYAEFEDINGCRSLRGIAASVVLPALDVPLVDNPIQTICSGDSAVFNASSLLGGTTFEWYDAPVNGNKVFEGAQFSTGPISNANPANATVIFYVSVKDGNGCSSLRTPVTTVVTPALDLPLVTPPVQTACPGDSVTFSATSLLGNSTFRWYDAPVDGNLLHTGADFNTGPLANPGPGNATVNYFVEVEDAMGCVSVRNIASVIILPALALPLYTPLNPIICNGDSVEFVASGVPELPNYFWYDNLTATTPIATGKSFNTGPLVNATGTDAVKTFFLEGEDANGCRTARIPVTATIRVALDLPLVANTPAIICSGDSVEFTASSLLGSGVTYYWYDAALGGNLLSQGEDFNTGPLTNNSGLNAVHTYWVELEDANGCRSLRNSASAIIRPALDVPLVNPPVATICSGDSATFIATSLLGTDDEFYWYDALVGGNLIFTGDTFTTSSLSASGPNNATLTVYVEFADTNGCRSLRAPATIVVVPAIDVPLVDNPVQVICNGGEATFIATSLLGADNFAWYDALIGGNLLFQGDTFNTGPLTNPNLTDATRLFYVEALDSNGCSSIRLPVTVILRPNLDLPVVLPPVQTVCNGESGTFIATSVGNLLGQPVSFHWYTSLTGGTEIFEGDTFVTPPAVNSSGTDFTAMYYVEVADSNDCRSLRLPVTLIIRPALDLPLVTPPVAVICASDSAEFVASSLLGSAQEFYWYDSILAGNEIFVGDTFNTGPIANTGGADLTKIFYVELEDTLGCRSLRFPATVIIRPSLSVPVINPPLSIVCEGDSVELVATALFDGEFRWYDALTGGNLLFVGDTFQTGPLSNVSGTDLDTLFYVEAVDTAGCVGLVRTFATVIIRPALNVPLVTPTVDTICSGGTAEFVASGVLPGARQFYWYETLMGGSPVFVGDTFRTTINSNGSTANIQKNYYVELEDSTGCRSVRTLASVLVTPGLDMPIVDPALQRICSGTQATIVASALNTTGSDFFWYGSVNGNDLLFQGDTFITDTLNNLSGSDAAFTFFVELKDTTGEGCVSQRVSATVIVTPSPDMPVIENPFTTICNGDSVLIIASSNSDVPGAIYWYEAMDSTNAIFVGDTLNTGALFNGTQAVTTHDFFAEYRDSSGCRSMRAMAIVSIQPALDAPMADPMNQTICAGGDASVKGTSLSPSTATYNWYDVQTGGTPFDTGDSIVIRDIQNNTGQQQVFTYYVESVDSAGCTSARTPFTVTVQAPSEKPTITPGDTTICTENSATLTANSPSGDNATYRWYDEASDANPIFVGRTFTTPVYYNFDGSLQQHDFFVQVEDSIGCSSGLQAVVVTVEPNGDDVLGQQINNPTCHGDQARIRGISNLGYTNFKWYLNRTDTNPFFQGDTLITAPLFADTTFYISSYDGSGCSSARFAVNVKTLEIITLGTPEPRCLDLNSGERVGFEWDAVDNAEFYEVSIDNGQSWKPSNAGTQHFENRISDDQEGVTILVRAAQTPTACSDKNGPVSFQLFCSFGEFLPDRNPFNAFSPNGDGKNDVWYIQDGIEDFPDNEVAIYNRWGKEIFKTVGYDNDQNVFTGEGQEDGAYYYVIRIPSINKEKTGYVMIIR